MLAEVIADTQDDIRPEPAVHRKRFRLDAEYFKITVFVIGAGKRTAVFMKKAIVDTVDPDRAIKIAGSIQRAGNRDPGNRVMTGTIVHIMRETVCDNRIAVHVRTDRAVEGIRLEGVRLDTGDLHIVILKIDRFLLTAQRFQTNGIVIRLGPDESILAEAADFECFGADADRGEGIAAVIHHRIGGVIGLHLRSDDVIVDNADNILRKIFKLPVGFAHVGNRYLAAGFQANCRNLIILHIAGRGITLSRLPVGTFSFIQFFIKPGEQIPGTAGGNSSGPEAVDRLDIAGRIDTHRLGDIARQLQLGPRLNRGRGTRIHHSVEVIADHQ